jgi:hypothetical protein
MSFVLITLTIINKNLMKTYTFILLVTFILVLSCCTKPEIHASNSLVGTWKVDSLVILYINKTSTGSSGTDSIWESKGDIGSFDFTEEMVKFNYKKRNIHQNDNVNYTLHAFKKNAGFTKVRKWEIILPNKTYSLEFGDQTSDAHKNARKITLTFEPNEVGKNEVEIIHLGKR